MKFVIGIAALAAMSGVANAGGMNQQKFYGPPPPYYYGNGNGPPNGYYAPPPPNGYYAPPPRRRPVPPYGRVLRPNGAFPQNQVNVFGDSYGDITIQNQN